ncbi:cytochrome-c peroxidase [Leptospira wolffii]|uniref:cytochrome-c peroxidase n=1 Tax=Leptospira wolffii TaxID=409998 RepID=UPI001FED4E78|nr:cytochrome c peroxidase [Leptospira wolffii]
MFRNLSLVFAFLIISFSMLSCSSSKKNERIWEDATKIFRTIPNKVPGSNSDTPELVSLGRKLYNDNRLSLDNSISCNSCHPVSNGQVGTDNATLSIGVRGKRTQRNTPSVINSAFQFALYRDGRFSNYNGLIKDHLLNNGEMKLASERELESRISSDKEYIMDFERQFPREKKKVSIPTVTTALSAFLRTLVSKGSRFDAYLNGNRKVLTEQEQDGLALFLSQGCITCHNGPLLGGNSFRKIGVAHPYTKGSDKGRFNVTKRPQDQYFFKVPSLRNVSLTGPYFHDGSVQTLEEAVRQMGYYQLGKNLSPGEIESLVTFLKAISDHPNLQN